MEKKVVCLLQRTGMGLKSTKNYGSPLIEWTHSEKGMVFSAPLCHIGGEGDEITAYYRFKMIQVKILCGPRDKYISNQLLKSDTDVDTDVLLTAVQRAGRKQMLKIQKGVQQGWASDCINIYIFV